VAATVLTLKDLRDEVLGWLDEGGDTGTTKTNVDNAINQAHFNRLTKELWPFMIWDTPETFTYTSGLQTYPLHMEFHRPFYFWNRTKNTYLREVPARTLAPSGARWNTDRDQMTYTLWGRSPVQKQPTTPGAVSIVSSSASDASASKNVTFRGISNGSVQTETLTPNGTSLVTGTTTFSKILGITKAADWAGNLTVSSGSDTLLQLNPSEFGRSYQQMFLLGAPSTADVIEYRFYRMPAPLTADRDVPDIPPPFSRVLVFDALLMLYAYDAQTEPARMGEFQKWQAELDQGLRVAHLEQQGLESEPQFVRVTDDEMLWGTTAWVP
jgi:hypothetical protein